MPSALRLSSRAITAHTPVMSLILRDKGLGTMHTNTCRLLASTALGLILATSKPALADGTAECNTSVPNGSSLECGIDATAGANNSTAVGGQATTGTGVASTAVGAQ